MSTEANNSPLWCGNEEPHKDHWRYSPLPGGTRDYCSGRPVVPDPVVEYEYAVIFQPGGLPRTMKGLTREGALEWAARYRGSVAVRRPKVAWEEI